MLPANNWLHCIIKQGVPDKRHSFSEFRKNVNFWVHLQRLLHDVMGTIVFFNLNYHLFAFS